MAKSEDQAALQQGGEGGDLDTRQGAEQGQSGDEQETAPAPTPKAKRPKSWKRGGPFTEALALPEPARTAKLEALTQAGATGYLRTRSGNDERFRYGAEMLDVPGEEPRPYMAAHAIHLLFCKGKQVEEVS